MGGEQAAKTLLAIQLKGRGETVWEEEKNELLAKIQERYDEAADPRYAAARLWVDAIIDPMETRQIVARSLACTAQNPQIDEFKTGVLQT
jgi:acetyl-CoA carboxylase carboxyltransferase component